MATEQQADSRLIGLPVAVLMAVTVMMFGHRLPQQLDDTLRLSRLQEMHRATQQHGQPQVEEQAHSGDTSLREPVMMHTRYLFDPRQEDDPRSRALRI